MADSSDDLERLSREQLILKARVLGVERPELMTRVEMRDEIVRRSEPDLAQQKRARGFLGVARDLVASVVEAGLNLPDAAALIRGDGSRESHWKGPPPVATVTLAEIYAAQGHLERALRMLDEVLAKEPDHDPARALRTRLATATDLPVAPARRRQRVSFADNTTAPAEEPVAVPADAPPPVAEPVTAPEEAPAQFAAEEPAPVAAEAPAQVQVAAEEPAPVAAEAPAQFAAEEPAPVAAEAPAQFAAEEPAPVAAEAPAQVQVAAEEPAHTPAEEPVHMPAEEPAPRHEPMTASAEVAPLAVDAPVPASAAPVDEPAGAPAPESASLSTGSAPSASESVAASAPISPPALVTLSLSGQRQIYWELPSQSLTALRAHSPSGRPVVRVISFRTRAGRVERHARDFNPHSEVGFAVLPDLRADAVVRAVLGWEVDGRFLPYVVASDLPSGSPSALRNGPFRASPLVGALSPEVEQRALSYCSRRPAH